MSAKKVTIPTKRPSKQAEDFVSGGKEQPATPPKSSAKNKRLTLDIPDDLHRRIKLRSVEKGTTMVELLRNVLEANFPSNG